MQPVQRYDVVVFRAPDHPERNYIKRIIGLAGEEVIVENGTVKVNGQPLADPNRGQIGRAHV